MRRPAREPRDRVDLLTYGTPKALGLRSGEGDRVFQYNIGRRPGFFDGKPGLWWTINGHQYPDVPMFMVTEGDIVRMTIKNTSGQVHPMHLHGHHVVVLSRNGVAATGSPWWTDSLNVEDDETYEVAFVADNPGIWMDHCHNLPHAAQGLVTHLMYTGVTTKFHLGGATGQSARVNRAPDRERRTEGLRQAVEGRVGRSAGRVEGLGEEGSRGRGQDDVEDVVVGQAEGLQFVHVILRDGVGGERDLAGEGHHRAVDRVVRPAR